MRYCKNDQIVRVYTCLSCAVYVIMDSYSLSYSSWCAGLPSEVTAVLDKERFISLASLKHSTEDDIKELNLRRGLHVLLRKGLKELQQEHGVDPCAAVSYTHLTLPTNHRV